MPILKHDIASALPPRRIHGLAGDTVRVIARHDHILIVEGPDKLRFAILDDDLTERLPDAVDPPKHVKAVPAWMPPTDDTPPPELPQPTPVASGPPAKSPPPRSGKRGKPSEPKSVDNQGSLF